MANFRESERKLAELMNAQNPQRNKELDAILERIKNRQEELKAKPDPEKWIIEKSVRTYG